VWQNLNSSYNITETWLDASNFEEPDASGLKEQVTPFFVY